MKPIIQLERNLINKIAAGEVVERPLSVVKELTENAIDAGATTVTVEIKDGGLTLVRVTDNGGGIPANDLPLAFARHATSKIASFDDLMQVQTLGFRGEALSSIAAVAQVEMITKTAEAMTGTRVEIHGGELLSSREIGCADGTTIIVANLFYNTPARRKFLKKPATEAGYIAHCMERLALANPCLTLRYINNGEIVFQTNGNGDLRTVLLNIYGREAASKVAAVEATSNEMQLTGLVGKPETARGNRQHGSFFINGRYIQSRLLTRAVETAMKTMLPSGKFPLFALNLAIPPDRLDVNVHPTKMDVRFADEDEVYNFIESAVRDALEEHNLIPTVRLRDKVGEKTDAPEVEQLPLPPTRSRDYDLSDLLPQRHKKTSSRMFELEDLSPPSPAPKLRDMKNASLSVREDVPTILIQEPAPQETTEKFFTNCRIQGLIFGTYWLVSQDASLYIIDQHAAHERVLYEEFLQKAREETVHAQTLLIPTPLRLTPQERQILHENRALFSQFGFEISDSEDNPELLSVPFLMRGPMQAGFFTDLLDKMGDTGFSKDSPYTHKTEIIAMAACKAAVKGGDSLSESEARALVEQLLTLNNPFTCPHGRPTIIEITRRELEQRFKRS